MKKLLILLLLPTLLMRCARKSDSTAPKMEYASGLSIDKHKGYTQVTVYDPWKKGAVRQTYILVPRSEQLPSPLPKGTVVRTPLHNVLVYSSVHANLIKELGMVSSIKSVCDARYFKIPEIVAGLKTGAITDCGASMSPSIEKVASTTPEAILLSPFQNSTYGALANTGTPIIELADYMEQTPLGRAEWMKFIGLLYGREATADSLFREVENHYNVLKKLVEKVSERPEVLSETMTSGVWYVPGGASYKAALFRDAGADYPWADNTDTGSLALDFAQVLYKEHDADYWLVTTYGQKLDKRVMLAIYPHNDERPAFNNHGVYYVDSSTHPIFEDTPFHPELLLREYIKIFHGELLPDYELHYYKPMAD